MIASNGQDHAHAREIARGLATSLRAAIEAARDTNEGMQSLAWGAAKDVVELLELHGLAALLAACEAHVGAPAVAVANVLDRVARLVQETENRGDITPFSLADRELAALAGTLAAQDWELDVEDQAALVSVQPLAPLLADFAMDDAAAIERSQVTLQVAAALRAALDWLGADAGGPIRVTVQDAALTLAVRVTHEPGLAPAGAVLALTGGALLPEPDGRWAVRVPLYAVRPAYLLARQGQLRLALAWHAVARLRIAGDAARAVMTEPSLTPWTPLSRTRGERPLALLAQGLTRAWLHLDHIVWRVFARPEPGRGPAGLPGGRQVVRTEEGAEYWVVDANEALRDVPQLHTPPPIPRPRAASGAVSSPPALEVVAEPARAPELAHATAVPEESLEPPMLGPEHVRPLERFLTPPLLPAAIVRPSSTPAPEPPAAVVAPPAPVGRPEARRGPEPSVRGPEPSVLEPKPSVLEPKDASPMTRASRGTVPVPLEPDSTAPAALAPSAPNQRRALIVDDSLVARLALARVLEREGWAVEGVERASEMWTALRENDWSLVLVDVFLPDASGRGHLRSLVAHQQVAARRFEVVALTRDSAEQQLVVDAGITRILRKPFAPGVVEGLIRELSRIGSDR